MERRGTHQREGTARARAAPSLEEGLPAGRVSPGEDGLRRGRGSRGPREDRRSRDWRVPYPASFPNRISSLRAPILPTITHSFQRFWESLEFSPLGRLRVWGPAESCHVRGSCLTTGAPLFPMTGRQCVQTRPRQSLPRLLRPAFFQIFPGPLLGCLAHCPRPVCRNQTQRITHIIRACAVLFSAAAAKCGWGGGGASAPPSLTSHLPPAFLLAEPGTSPCSSKCGRRVPPTPTPQHHTADHGRATLELRQ